MVAFTQLPAPVATLTGYKTKTKTMWNPSQDVRWRRDSRGIKRRIDVRRDIDGNDDQDFYTAWDTAVYERSAEAQLIKPISITICRAHGLKQTYGINERRIG